MMSDLFQRENDLDDAGMVGRVTNYFFHTIQSQNSSNNTILAFFINVKFYKFFFNSR
jgi:hypothetical protein